MTSLAERSVVAVERRLSRRGFLATCGKLTLGLGLAMAGVANRAWPALAACCPGIACDTAHSHPCPPGGAGCPTGCGYLGRAECCDSGVLHRCWNCDCSGVPCTCEETVGTPC
jgi:hypothetical protein